MRPVSQTDYDALYALSTDPCTSFRWRFRGSTPSPDQFLGSLWHQVLAQFVVVAPDDPGRPLGLVVANRADFRSSHAHIAMVFSAGSQGHPLVMESMALFIEYLFEVFNLRKLYFETLEFNLSQFRSGTGKFFVEEGRLREHDYHDGRWWDLHVMAIYRDQWADTGARLVAGSSDDNRRPDVHQIALRNGRFEFPDDLPEQAD